MLIRELWVHTKTRGEVADLEYIWVMWSISWGTRQRARMCKFQPGFTTC